MSSIIDSIFLFCIPVSFSWVIYHFYCLVCISYFFHLLYVLLGQHIYFANGRADTLHLLHNPHRLGVVSSRKHWYILFSLFYWKYVSRNFPFLLKITNLSNLSFTKGFLCEFVCCWGFSESVQQMLNSLARNGTRLKQLVCHSLCT